MSKTNFGTFVADVRVAGNFGTNFEAIEAIRSTLRSVSDCLPGTLANDVAAELPTVLADSLQCDVSNEGERLTAHEFTRRVAWREKIDEFSAHQHAAVILAFLAPALTTDLLNRVRTELPEQYADLLVGEPPLDSVHMHQAVL